MSHTPGPWKIITKLGYQAPEIASETRPIAKVLYHHGSEDREVDANAHLIAVSLDLLAACEALLEIWEGPARDYEALSTTLEQARAAITKARGESS